MYVSSFARIVATIGCGLGMWFAGLARSQSTPSQPSPNVIFILCDDLGWGDLGVLYQNDRDTTKRLVTPNLDRMALSGVQLRNHYCPAPVCVASRASLLLGQHQGNCGVRDNQFDKALPDQINIAGMLKAAGYRTALVGKYGLQGEDERSPASPADLPDAWPAYPTRRGFDDFFGYVRHVDGHQHYPADAWELGDTESHRAPKQLWHNQQEISGQLRGCYTTDLFTAYAKDWIVRHRAADRAEPFFMYLAYDTPHAALQLPPGPYPEGSGATAGIQWTGRSDAMINTAAATIDSYRHPDVTGRGWSDVEERFATMVRRIDDCVGDLLQTLDDLGIADNTLVILTSDNGPHHESYLASSQYEPTSFHSYGPFDGIKRDVWEGGIRVPAIACWPAKIPAKTIDSTPSQFHDWMATLADAASLPVPASCDGVSLLPTITANGTRSPSTIYVEYQQSGQTPPYADFHPDKAGKRRGQMQVVHLDGYKGVRLDIQDHADPFRIYDLSSDPKETIDLADTSDAMRSLQSRMRQRVLQLRIANSSAPRPYDDHRIASIQVSETPKRGAVLMGSRRDTPYLHRGDQDGFVVANLEDPGDVAIQIDPARVASVRSLLNVPADGRYRFRLKTKHASLWRMHGFHLIDGQTATEPEWTGEATVHLQAGMHPIALFFSCPDGDLAYTLQWSCDGQPFVTMAADSFFVSP